MTLKLNNRLKTSNFILETQWFIHTMPMVRTKNIMSMEKKSFISLKLKKMTLQLGKSNLNIENTM